MTAENQQMQVTRVIAEAVRQRENRRTGKTRRNGLVLLLVMIGAGLLLALVLGAGHPNDNSAPTCDGQSMQPGDLCEHYRNGVHTGTTTFQDGLDEKHNGSATLRVIGWVLVGLGVVLIVPRYRANDPRVPWGSAVAAACPRCGRASLREKSTSVSEKRGRKTVTTTGIVTLCGPDCEFVHIRRP